MRLQFAAVSDFRNIVSADISFSPQFTAFLGPNGQGKTNAVEALYLIAALRPLRNVVRRALIREGATTAEIRVQVDHERTGLRHDLSLALRGGTRILTKDDKRCDAAQFLGHAVAIAFTPDDLQLAKGGPDGRRRFLDRALLNVRPAYLRAALRYQKAIKDRNKLLATDATDPTLDAFDLVVAQEGAQIALARCEYVHQVASRVLERFGQIAQPAPTLSLKYRSSLIETPQTPVDTLVAAFVEQLRRRREHDRRRKITSVGPHLDDLQLTLDGAPARDRASQGQHRALVLSLKLAEIEHLAEQLQEAPILFLDDMSSELDEDRSRQLFDAVRRLDGQVILTSTESRETVLNRLGASADVRVYRVRQGELTEATD